MSRNALAHRLVLRTDALIDLHSHILPGIDDGAPNIEVSLAMARAAVANGVSVLACTPHIMPGVWNNNGPQIRSAVDALRSALENHGVALHLTTGADVHIAPNLVAGLRSGHILSLHDTRYVLLELPHHIVPPRADTCFLQLLDGGYFPVFTHPERLSWIEKRYDLVETLYEKGVWMQITAGSLSGRFGKRAQQWAHRMLRDGFVHILASDTHNLTSRPPDMAQGWEAARAIVGDDEAYRLVVERPYAILSNNDAASVLPPPPISSKVAAREKVAALTQGPQDRSPHTRDRPTRASGNPLDWLRGLIKKDKICP